MRSVTIRNVPSEGRVAWPQPGGGIARYVGQRSEAIKLIAFTGDNLCLNLTAISARLR